jgi:hypothetical protein
MWLIFKPPGKLLYLLRKSDEYEDYTGRKLSVTSSLP